MSDQINNALINLWSSSLVWNRGLRGSQPAAKTLAISVESMEVSQRLDRATISGSKHHRK